MPNSEYYNQNVYSKISEYNGRIYYINSSYNGHGYLCSSDSGGENIEIIADVKDDFRDSYIYINDTGIYLYYLGDYDRLLVQHLSLKGSLISECREEYEGGYNEGHNISALYSYDSDIYYVYKRNYMDEHKCVIKCMHIDEKRVEVIYKKAAAVNKLYATADKIIFLARYENDKCGELQADGWMVLDLNTYLVESLSNPYCSPENVIDDPDVYDEENPRYNDRHDYDRDIVFFDMNRLIFWTRRYEIEGDDSRHLKRIQYWEPHALWTDRDSIVADMPIWKVENSSSTVREYFDGIHHYYSEGYYVFKSSDKFGHIYEWSAGNGGHGVCNDFRVIGDYLYLNIAAYDEEQYPLGVGIGEPVRKSWFDKKLPQNALEAYINRKSSKGMLENELPEEREKKKIADVPAEVEKADLTVEKVIGNTDVKYNICTFGSKFHIGFDVPVTIRMNGKEYSAKSHKSVKGRIDGMKKLYSENGIELGDKLRVTYYSGIREIHLERIN